MRKTDVKKLGASAPLPDEVASSSKTVFSNIAAAVDGAFSPGSGAEPPNVVGIQELVAVRQIEILDALDSAAVLLDADGNVICCNHAFFRLPQIGIALHDRKLSATDPGSDEKLQRMLRSAMASALPAEEMCTVILVRENRRPLLGTLLIVHRHLERFHSAILLFTNPDDRSWPDEAVLRGAFGLTPSEARLAQSLATGESLGDTAIRSKLSRRTITRQLRAIFQKTRLHRRSELVRLLISLRGPPLK